MKTLLVAFFIISMFTAGWHLAPSNTTQKNPMYEESDQAKLREKIVDLQNEISQLKHFNSARNQVPMEKNDDTKPSIDEKNLVKPAIEEKMRRLAENYKNIKDYDLTIATKNAFEAEPLESEWAQPRVEALQNLMSSDRNFQGINLKGIECKSKHCRIEIFSNQPSETDGMTSTLNRVIEEKANLLFIPYTELQYSPEEKTATIYLTDDPSASLY